MSERDQAYLQLLQVGLLLFRQALDSGDPEWARAESEFLHNVPSLIGETNEARHRFFWEKERAAYLNWLREKGSAEARSRTQTFYEPVLGQLEPLVEHSGNQVLGTG